MTWERLKVNLCPKCTRTLKARQACCGPEAFAQACGDIAARCEVCSQQFPDDLRRAILSGDAVMQNRITS